MLTKGGGGPVLFLLLTILAAPVCLAQEKIEWEAVAGADHYLVEIRQNGKLVFEVQTKEPFVPLFLPLGDYTFQIKVIDAFGNVRSTGEPSRLKISALIAPFIIDVSPRIIHEDGEPVFSARVSGLLENEEQSTTFALENDEKEKIQLNWETSGPASEGWIEISLTKEKLPKAGTWHLTMSNPDGREDRLENAIVISRGSQPRIISVKPKRFVAGIPDAVLRLRTRDFDGDAALLIDGPSEIPVAKLNQGEKDVFEFSLNLKNALEGHYSISLVDSSGKTDTKTKALKIDDRKPRSLSEAKALKIDDREPRPLSEFPNAIHVGWRPIIRTGDPGLELPPPDTSGPLDSDLPPLTPPSSSFVFQPGYLGFTLGYSRNIENDLLRRIHYLDGLEWYFSASYAHSKVMEIIDFGFISEKLPAQDHHSLSSLFGISYVTWFDSPLNILAQIGLGVDVTLREHQNPPQRVNQISGKPLTSAELELYYPENSTSTVMSFDLGIRWDITARLFVNASANTMMKSEIGGDNEWSIQPRIEGGWNW